jgi:hypothetical protein
MWVGERGMSAEELQAIGRVRGEEPLEEQPTEQTWGCPAMGIPTAILDPKATYARPPSCKHQTYNCWPSRPIRSPPRRAPVSRAARRDRGFWRSWHAVRGRTTFLFNCQPNCTRAPDPARLTRSGSRVPFQLRYCNGSCRADGGPPTMSVVLGSGPRPSARARSSTRLPCSWPGKA